MLRTTLSAGLFACTTAAVANPLAQLLAPTVSAVDSATTSLAGVAWQTDALRAAGPLGITILEEGTNGSGIGRVLAIEPIGTLIDDQLDGIGTPLIGLDGDGGFVDVGLLNGDDTANAGPDGLLGACVHCGDVNGNGGEIGVAALSGSDSANGSTIGVGLLNDDHTGSGALLGVAALSGQDAGQSSDGLAVGLLNEGEVLRLGFGGETQLSLSGLASEVGGTVGEIELVDGINIGGVSESPNPLLNIGVLGGDGAGTGGLIGVGVLVGDNSGQGDLAGVCILCGDNSGTGVSGIGAAVLSGDNAGTGGLAGAGVLTGDNSAQGGVLGAGVLVGDNAGLGEVLGVGALTGDGSGNGGLVGVGALTGDGSGNGGAIGAGVIGGDGSGSGELGVGALTGEAGAGAGVPPGLGNGSDDGDAIEVGLVDPFRNAGQADAGAGATGNAGSCEVSIKQVGVAGLKLKQGDCNKPKQARNIAGLQG